MNKAALFLAGGSPQGQMVERHYRLSPIRLYGAGANAINQISEIIGRPQASRRLFAVATAMLRSRSTELSAGTAVMPPLQELHTAANVNKLPNEEFEDMSLVY